MTIRDESVVTHAPQIAWVASPGRVAILRLFDVRSEALTLTGSAATIWRVTGDRQPVADVISRVSQEYGVPSEEIRDSVLTFMSDSLSHGVMVQETE